MKLHILKGHLEELTEKKTTENSLPAVTLS